MISIFWAREAGALLRLAVNKVGQSGARSCGAVCSQQKRNFIIAVFLRINSSIVTSAIIYKTFDLSMSQEQRRFLII
jgi:hypothetical protein